jgi:hypothetical protein
MIPVLKRKIHRNIWFIKSSFFVQKVKRSLHPERGFHLDKVDKILAAKELFGIDFFLETGTYLGTTVNYVKDYFSQVYSVELSKDLASEAQSYFKKIKHVSILQGDSGLLIAKIIKDNPAKKLFWLDAHYSAGITASSAHFGDTPISQEVEEILSRWVEGSVILIDDARLFVGKDNYPTLQDLKEFVVKKNLNLKMFVDKDIICIL